MPNYAVTINISPTKRWDWTFVERLVTLYRPNIKYMKKYDNFRKLSSDDQIIVLNAVLNYLVKKIGGDWTTPTIEYTQTGNPHYHVWMQTRDDKDIIRVDKNNHKLFRFIDDDIQIVFDILNLKLSANKTSQAIYIEKTNVDIFFWQQYSNKDVLKNCQLPDDYDSCDEWLIDEVYGNDDA